jgi:hypothetical protein
LFVAGSRCSSARWEVDGEHVDLVGTGRCAPKRNAMRPVAMCRGAQLQVELGDELEQWHRVILVLAPKLIPRSVSKQRAGHRTDRL